MKSSLPSLFGSPQKVVDDALDLERPGWTGVPVITLDAEDLFVHEKDVCVTLSGNETTAFYSLRRALFAAASEA